MRRMLLILVLLAAGATGSLAYWNRSRSRPPVASTTGNAPAATAPAPVPQYPYPGPGTAPEKVAMPEAPSSFAVAVQMLDHRVKTHPKDYSIRMMAGQFYMRAGRHAEAIPHLKVATGLTTRVLPWIALGDAATLSGQFALAHRAFDRATKIDPGNSLVLRSRGQLLVAQRRYPEARKYLEAGLRKYPENTNLRAALANLFLLLDQPRRAIAVLEPAVKREPYRSDHRALLGEAYERDLKIEAALREMREAVRLNPNLSEAWGRIGLYLINLARYPEAREPLERAITLEPMEAHFYWALGDSYLLEGPGEDYFRKATQFYRQALNLDPRNAKALYSYAMALTRRGKPEDVRAAIPLFKRLIALNKNDMNAHYKLAEAYRQLGEPKEAQRYQARFLQLYRKGRDQTRSRYQTAAFRDTPEVHVKLGREALARGENALAAREFQLALERDRTLSEARRGLLEAQKKLGQSHETGSGR